MSGLSLRCGNLYSLIVSFSIVVVRKKNGDMHLCVDYRSLKMEMVKHAYALPILEESLTELSRSQWFSVIDLKPGYYQIEMHKHEKPKTNFVFPFRFWKMNYMLQMENSVPEKRQAVRKRRRKLSANSKILFES